MVPIPNSEVVHRALVHTETKCQTTIMLVMSIGYQKFGIPRKYQNQFGIWYFCLKCLGIFWVFYRYFENDIVKIWLNIGILGRIKVGLVFGFCVCHFIGIGLVSVCHFPENDISTSYPRIISTSARATSYLRTSAGEEAGVW